MTVSFATLTPATCSVAGTSVTMVAVGTCTLAANQAGNANYSAAGTVQQSFQISQGSQTITFGAQSPQTYVPSATFGLNPVASASSGLAVGYATLTASVCTIAGSTVTIVTAGTCTIAASQDGDSNYSAATDVTQDIAINPAGQTISWGAQTSPRTYALGATFLISPTATGGASGNPVIYTSLTTPVCTVSSLTVTMVSAGTCTLAANQAGDGNYSAAIQVTRVVTINPVVPGAPNATSIIASDAQVVIEFDPPASDGGSPITAYRATCNPGGIFANGAASPIKVTGLTNNTAYTCSVAAQNAAGNSVASNTLMATPILDSGANLWTNVCSGCHGAQPAGVRFNAAGTTGNVIDYVRSVQPLMQANNAVQALTLNELAEIAKYIETFVPAISMNTAFNVPVNVDVAGHLTLGTVSFEVAEVVTPPQHGTLGAFTGTVIAYTPAPGYVGMDTFTYRGNHSAPGVPGDAHTVTITVAPPPAPVITSPSIFSGVFGVATSYQITATNSPTSYGASGLGAGFSINTMSGLISGTPNAAGSFMVTVSASNAGGTGMQVVSITISKASQTITFGAQGGQSYTPAGTFMLSPVATADSGLAVAYSSLTTAVCTISGTLVTIVTAGTCTIAADQAGNTNYNAALQVARNIAISATVPGAPTIGTATAGDTTASIAFTPPANTGGSPITSYTAACNPGPVGAAGSSSPITVTGLTNSTLYTCAVRATNAAGNSAFSGTVMVTPTATPVAPQIVSANATTFTVGAAGNFTVSATGTPAPTLALVGALPSGVTFTPASGALAGTPALGSVGSYPVTITATGTPPAAMQSFTLTVQKAGQSISYTGPASQPYTPTPITLSASATSGLTVSFASNTTSVCTVAGTSLTLITVGTCSVTASQTGNANYNAATPVTQGFNVTQSAQTITFAAQSPASRNFVGGSTFAVSPTASASSGLPISYSSTTAPVCTLVGNTITMVSPGTCTIAANQSGSANYLAAPQVTQNVALNATAPGAPTIGPATPGNAQATIAFTPPANNGGSAITGYTATCNPGIISAGGTSSPIVVMGLTNNVAYTCSVTATNGIGTSAASATVNVTPLSGQGITTWQNVCSFCHGSTPVGNQLNAAGTTATVLDYVRNNQSLMKIYQPVKDLSLADLADVAAYIATELPANDVTTSMNTPVPVSVAGHIKLTGQIWSAFDSVEVVTPPTHGSLGAFTGTTATYTPTAGYLGPDSFTYRGKLNSVHVGDPQTVSIMVNPPAPAITSATSATGTFGQAFSYQITASNTPTAFDAVNLPAGLGVNQANGLISGTPAAAGSFNVSISASNSGGFGQATLMLQVDPAPQAIIFGAQTSPRTWSASGTFAISPTATGGGSNIPIVYGSLSTGVCTVSGTTVTIVAAGSCVISANQAGNTNYAAAPQVTQSVTINAIAPGAPLIGAGTAGNAQATISFSPPASNGGSPIISYTATCTGGITGTGSASPITVTGLTNGVTYACTVTATNAATLTGPASGNVMVTPVSLLFTGLVQSRKTHGGIDRNITIAPGPITGPVTVEPRSIGAGHRIVFTFNNPVTSVTSVVATDATPAPVGSAAASFSGNELIVTLTGIPDGQRVTVTVSGANGTSNAAAAVGFLVGDVNDTRAVNASDIAAVKKNLNLPTTAANFRMDFDANGTITSADVTTVKSRSGMVLLP